MKQGSTLSTEKRITFHHNAATGWEISHVYNRKWLKRWSAYWPIPS